MEVIFQPILDAKGGTFLERRIQITQKEVQNVHQTAEPNADLFLRRLESHWAIPRSGGSPSAPGIPHIASIKKRLDQQAIMPRHQTLLLHAACLQVYAFSGGTFGKPQGFCPLWLTLAIEGRGLRRMSQDTSQHANRLLTFLRILGPEPLGRIFFSNPRLAYRLGLFELARQLRPVNENPEELTLRLDLALKPFDETVLTRINDVAGSNIGLRINLLSSASAYAAKKGKDVSAEILSELEQWVASTRSKIAPAHVLLFAQVINAINLIHLGQGNEDAITTNMNDLLTNVIPQIKDPDRRGHIEGNAHYQRSILARKRGERDVEIRSLLHAMASDQHFGTLYYRMAQHFHDQGDSRAEPFYEMALLLSPMDLATANDYGCYLADSGETQKLESWSAVCQALFPEQFTEAKEEAL